MFRAVVLKMNLDPVPGLLKFLTVNSGQEEKQVPQHEAVTTMFHSGDGVSKLSAALVFCNVNQKVQLGFI